MPKKTFSLEIKGTFIELCLTRVSTTQIDRAAALGVDIGNGDPASWYANDHVLNSVFNAENWWALDDLDHTMGLLFKDRRALEAKLATIGVIIDNRRVTIDPDALQLSVYALETIPDLAEGESILRHGARREATLHLDAEFTPPFDPELITLSMIRYPGVGLVLIDLDYDGYDELNFTWGETDYIQPRLIGKDAFDDTAG